LVEPARRAVTLAERAGDAGAQAEALLAVHDALWSPGTANERLPVIAEMLGAACTAGDRDLVAQAHQLRAAALIELGDPAGRDELLTYIGLAAGLGHARGRWGALTRQATYAQIAGRADEAARLGQEALAVGRAIGEPDAMGCFATSRGSLVALGVDPPEQALDMADPMWPMFPLLRAWAPAVRGDLAAARTALGDFSVRDVVWWTGLEAPAVAAVVFAAVGSTEQRRWAYDTLLPHAGSHVVVGGCASYHAAVDHHSVRWPPRSATSRPPIGTSGRRWPSTSGSARPAGPGCRRRPWPLCRTTPPTSSAARTADGSSATPGRTCICRMPRGCMTCG
jgi:hypothetical protein